MNTRNASYGSVCNTGLTFQAQFWNPINQTRILLGNDKDEEKARKILNDYCFDFYSKNSWLLPKCISINTRDRKFKFALPFGKKTVHYGQYDTLQEAVDAKMAFINKLLV